MTSSRVFSLPAHGVLELLVGLIALGAGFAMGFGPAASVIAIGLGSLLVGLALMAEDTLPVATHYAFDQALAAGSLAAAVALTIDGDGVAALFFALLAVAQMALVLTTRYTRPT